MESLVRRLATFSAALGGAALSALILMTCVSILGRAFSRFGLGPVPGDFELVEAGIAFAVFAFLPLCQLNAGHATVDLLVPVFGKTGNRWLLALWETIAALVAALILWRLWAGFLSKLGNGETTLMLQFPIWWAYAACLFPAAVLVLASLWSASDRLRGALTGRDSRPITGESLH